MNLSLHFEWISFLLLYNIFNMMLIKFNVCCLNFQRSQTDLPLGFPAIIICIIFHSLFTNTNELFMFVSLYLQLQPTCPVAVNMILTTKRILSIECKCFLLSLTRLNLSKNKLLEKLLKYYFTYIFFYFF